MAGVLSTMLTVLGSAPAAMARGFSGHGGYGHAGVGHAGSIGRGGYSHGGFGHGVAGHGVVGPGGFGHGAYGRGDFGRAPIADSTMANTATVTTAETVTRMATGERRPRGIDEPAEPGLLRGAGRLRSLIAPIACPFAGEIIAQTGGLAMSVCDLRMAGWQPAPR